MLAWLLGVLTFAPGARWGLPHVDGRDPVRGWAVDDETPLGVLAEIRNIRRAPPDRNLGYPLFHSIMNGAVYAPYLAWLRLTGRWAEPSGTYPYGLSDATSQIRVLALLSRALTLVFAGAIVMSAFLIGRTLWDAMTGAAAAGAVALAYPLSYYARTGNVDVPMLGFAMMALAVLAVASRVGLTSRGAMLFGTLAGLSLATKEQSVGLFLAGAAIVGTMPLAGAGPAGAAVRPVRTLVMVGIAGFLAFGAGSGLFIDPERFLAHVRFLLGVDGAKNWVEGTRGHFPMTMDGHVAFALNLFRRQVDVLNPLGLAIATFGIATSFRRVPASRWLWASAATYAAFLFVGLRWDQLRYALPLGVIAAVGAGVGFMTGLRDSRRWVRQGTVVVGVAAAAISLLRYLDLTHAMLRDSRYAAAAWMARELRPGDRVEYFGAAQKLPIVPGGIALTRAARYAGMFEPYDTSATAGAAILAAWSERKPNLVIVMPDHSSRSPLDLHDATVPPSLFRALESGSLPLRPAAVFQTRPLFPFARRPSLDYPVVNPPIRLYGPP